MKFKFIKNYSIAINGYKIYFFKPGDEFTTDDPEAVQTIQQSGAIELPKLEKAEEPKKAKKK